MYNLNSMLDRACEQFDLESYLIDHGFSKGSKNEWIAQCPKCGKQKLTCNADKRVWQCWVCARFGLIDPVTRKRRIEQGAGGIIKLIQWVQNVTVADAKEIVLSATRQCLDPKELRPPVIKFPVTPIARHAVPAPEFAQPITTELPYMIKRGITLADARMFGLFWCNAGKYANRLIFPVWENSELIYWQARAMWEKDDQSYGPFVKALNPPKGENTFVSSDVLFNLEQASKYQRVAICEGPIDAVHTGPDAVCTFGKRISPAQVIRLIKAKVRAIDLMWDGPGPTEPEGAWPEMVTFAPQLALFFDVRLVRLPLADPGSYTRAEIEMFRKQNSVEYK